MGIRNVTVIASLGLLVMTAACGGDTTDGTATTDPSTTEAAATTADSTPSDEAPSAAADPIRIGITQFATIPPLDGLRESFIERMDEEYGEDGWEFEYLPAEGNVGNTSSIAVQLAAGDFDAYLAIATASAQAMAQEITDAPIIFAAVADPAGAGIRSDDAGDDGNATGVSSLGPIGDQMQLIVDAVEGLDTLGILYNDAEQNAIYQADIAEEEIGALGDYSVTRQTASTSAEVSAAARQLASESTAMWFPASSTALEGLPALYGAAQEAGVPLFCADTTAVVADDNGDPRGCIGTIGFSFPGTGVTAAELMIEVLNGTAPGTIPTVFPEAETTVLNVCAAEAIGFTFPQSVLDSADEVIECS